MSGGFDATDVRASLLVGPLGVRVGRAAQAHLARPVRGTARGGDAAAKYAPRGRMGPVGLVEREEVAPLIGGVALAERVSRHRRRREGEEGRRRSARNEEEEALTHRAAG